MVKLVILDMDGVLFTRDRFTKDNKYDNHDFVFKGYKYYIREGASEFISRLNDSYDLCIFTSMVKSNAIQIINCITKVRFKHIFGREHTKLDPEYGIDPDIKSYDTIKLINDVINCPILNKDRKYNLSNSIIIDDSYLKMRYNNPKNVIIYNHGSEYRWVNYILSDENTHIEDIDFVNIGSYGKILDYIETI